MDLRQAWLAGLIGLWACGETSPRPDVGIDAGARGDAAPGLDAAEAIDATAADAAPADAAGDDASCGGGERLPGAAERAQAGVEILASGLGAVRSVLAVGDALYMGASNAIERADLDGCGRQTAAPNQAAPRALAGDLRWIDASGALWSLGPPLERLASDLGASPGQVILDQESYALDRSCRLKVVRGGASVVLTSTQPGFSTSIRGAAGNIYYSCTNPSGIYEYDPRTGMVTPRVQRAHRISSFTVDQDRIFWGEDDCSASQESCLATPLPGCCPGKIWVATGTAAQELATDAISSALDLLVADGWVIWANDTELRRRRLDAGPGEGELWAPALAYPESLSLAGGYLYWASPGSKGSVELAPGFVARKRWP